MSWTRAIVLGSLVLVVAVQALQARRLPQGGLEQFAASAPPCAPGTTATPAVRPDGTFKAGAPVRPVLAGAATPGTRLELSGTVSGLRCGRIAGAVVDLWQPDLRGAYDMVGFALRGQQVTNKNGAYAFTTIVPGASAGRARHLSVRVHVTGHPDLWTEMFFPDDPANARDARFTKELLVQPKHAATGQAGTFDIWLDM